MRRSEDMPLDPDMLAELEAIDATLAGEAVDPEYAELAELALLLSSERELPSSEFVRTLDARAARRFSQGAPAAPRRLGRLGRFHITGPVVGTALAGAFADHGWDFLRFADAEPLPSPSQSQPRQPRNPCQDDAFQPFHQRVQWVRCRPE